MPSIDDLLQEFPAHSRAQLKQTWESLPPAVQKELQGALSYLPGDIVQWKMLMGMALTQYKIAFGQKRTIAIVGPANVGKSTLFNQMIRAKTDRAEVSAVPGTTRVNQTSDAGLFQVVDTPGADAVGEVGQQEKEHALAAAAHADFLVIVFDAIQGIKQTEHALFDELVGLGKPYVVVLNKIDLVRREADKVIERTVVNLRLQRHELLAISARDGKNVDDVLLAIAKADPEMVAALGQALPEFRWRLAWTAITGAASTAAAIALTPLPILDVIPLLVVQSSLVLGIARIYNYKITAQRARELVVTFGLGFLGRTLFQELSKLGGLPGWLLSAAIASSTTVVMGYAAIVWFEKGEKLTGESLGQLTKALTDYLLTALRDFGKKKPDAKSLREQMAEVLAKSPLADSRITLDETAKAGPPTEPPAPSENDR